MTPIFLRITSGRTKLVPGPFSLGRWYMPLGIVAVAWVCFITILLLFPPVSNPTADTMSKSLHYYSFALRSSADALRKTMRSSLSWRW